MKQTTFKQWLSEQTDSGLMDMPLLCKLINAKVKQMAPQRPYIFCEYDGVLHEGFIENAHINNDFSMMVDYKKWSEDENTFIPAIMSIYEEDVDLFYFGQYDGRKTLMCKHPSIRTDESREVYAQKIENVPDWAPSHAEGDYRVGSVVFSAKSGLGSVPFNQSVYYHGFVVECRPSVFLELALPHEGQRDGTARDIARLSKEGYALGIPWFDMSFSEVDEHDGHPRITGHEGRGRMLAIKQMIGDVPVPVHIMLRGGMRARNITHKHIESVKAGVFAEKSNTLVASPFTAIYVNGKKV